MVIPDVPETEIVLYLYHISVKHLACIQREFKLLYFAHRGIRSRLVTSQFTELTLGADVVESRSDQLTSSLQRVIPKGIYRSKAGPNAASIDFGAEIERR